MFTLKQKTPKAKCSLRGSLCAIGIICSTLILSGCFQKKFTWAPWTDLSDYYNLESGERISHTLNPQTGHSQTTSLLSATVIAPRCATADALATAFMASGEEEAIALAERLRDSVSVYFVLAPENGKSEYREFSTLKQ